MSVDIKEAMRESIDLYKGLINDGVSLPEIYAVSALLHAYATQAVNSRYDYDAFLGYMASPGFAKGGPDHEEIARIRRVAQTSATLEMRAILGVLIEARKSSDPHIVKMVKESTEMTDPFASTPCDCPACRAASVDTPASEPAPEGDTPSTGSSELDAIVSEMRKRGFGVEVIQLR